MYNYKREWMHTEELEMVSLVHQSGAVLIPSYQQDPLLRKEMT